MRELGARRAPSPCARIHGKCCASNCGLLFSKREGVEAPVAFVHHRDSHRDLACRPIPEPRQMGSPGGCRADEVLSKCSCQHSE